MVLSRASTRVFCPKVRKKAIFSRAVRTAHAVCSHVKTTKSATVVVFKFRIQVPASARAVNRGQAFELGVAKSDTISVFSSTGNYHCVFGIRLLCSLCCINVLVYCVSELVVLPRGKPIDCLSKIQEFCLHAVYLVIELWPSVRQVYSKKRWRPSTYWSRKILVVVLAVECPSRLLVCPVRPI